MMDQFLKFPAPYPVVSPSSTKEPKPSNKQGRKSAGLFSNRIMVAEPD